MSYETFQTLQKQYGDDRRALDALARNDEGLSNLWHDYQKEFSGKGDFFLDKTASLVASNYFGAPAPKPKKDSVSRQALMEGTKKSQQEFHSLAQELHDSALEIDPREAVLRGAAGDMSAIGEAVFPEQKVNGTLFEKLGDRQENAKNALLRGALDGNMIQGGLQATGQAAGAVADTVGAGIGVAAKGAGKIASAVTPDFIEDPIKNFFGGLMEDDATKSVLLTAANAGETYGDFRKKNPDIARTIESSVNVAELGGLTAATGAAKGVAQKRQLTKIDDIIDDGIMKGVKPTVRGKKSVARLDQFKQNGRDAVKSIVQRKEGLKLVDEFGEEIFDKAPENLPQFAQAIEQTKKQVFSEYSALAKQATDDGLIIELDDVVKQLDNIASDKAKRAVRPEVIEHAKRISDRFKKLGTVTPDEADEMIKELNSSLQSFYAGVGDRSKAQVEGSIAKKLRQSLDEAVSNSTDASFQTLKSEYGALRAIEDEVSKRALVEARKVSKGLLDMTDVFTGGELVSGALTMDPSSILRGAAGKSIKTWYKRLNDPNLAIKKMFKKVDDSLLGQVDEVAAGIGLADDTPLRNIVPLEMDEATQSFRSIADISDDVPLSAVAQSDDVLAKLTDDVVGSIRSRGTTGLGGKADADFARAILEAGGDIDEAVKLKGPTVDKLLSERGFSS